MKTNYVLIDYENVQPANLTVLAGEHFRVKVFVGANQARLPYDLVEAMQRLGDRGEYVRISGNGANALDFHIAYYIGRLAEREPKVFFHIISRDTGFDPLIAHLKAHGISASRSHTLDEIPILKGLANAPKDDQVEAVIQKLKGMPKSRPQREKTLKTMISAWFGKNLDEAALDRIVKELLKRQLIVLDGVKLSYTLPA
jgi:hypothetical protein